MGLFYLIDNRVISNYYYMQTEHKERLQFTLFDDFNDPPPLQKPPVPMVTPDAGIINMLRYGILALQLLPENTSAGGDFCKKFIKS